MYDSRNPEGERAYGLFLRAQGWLQVAEVGDRWLHSFKPGTDEQHCTKHSNFNRADPPLKHATHYRDKKQHA